MHYQTWHRQYLYNRNNINMANEPEIVTWFCEDDGKGSGGRCSPVSTMVESQEIGSKTSRSGNSTINKAEVKMEKTPTRIGVGFLSNISLSKTITFTY